MKATFLADANFNHLIVRGLRRRETLIDFLSAEAAELPGKPDSDVLRIAADLGRILVTHDRKTMPRAFAGFVSRLESPDVLILPQRLSLIVAIDELLLIWAASEGQEWINSISVLPL
jgi:hypothetical protein